MASEEVVIPEFAVEWQHLRQIAGWVKDSQVLKDSTIPFTGKLREFVEDLLKKLVDKQKTLSPNKVQNQNGLREDFFSTLMQLARHLQQRPPAPVKDVVPQASFLVTVLLQTKPGSEAQIAALNLLNPKSFVNSLHEKLRGLELEGTLSLLSLVIECLARGHDNSQTWAIQFLDTALGRVQKRRRRQIALILQTCGITKTLIQIAQCRDPKHCAPILRILANVVRHMDWDNADDFQRPAMETSLMPLVLRDWGPARDLQAAGQLLLVCACRAFLTIEDSPLKGRAQDIAAVLAPGNHLPISLKRAAATALITIMYNKDRAFAFCVSEGMQHVSSLLSLAEDARLLSTALAIVITMVNSRRQDIAANLVRAGVMTRLHRLDYDVGEEEVAPDPHNRREKRNSLLHLIIFRLSAFACMPDAFDHLELTLRCGGPYALNVARFLAVEGPLSKARRVLLDLGGLDALLEVMARGGEHWPDTALALHSLITRIEERKEEDSRKAVPMEADTIATANEEVVQPAGGMETNTVTVKQEDLYLADHMEADTIAITKEDDLQQAERMETNVETNMDAAGLLPTATIYTPETADMTFIVDGHAFPAHRAALAACSEVFESMFTDGLVDSDGKAQLTITDVPSAVWQVVLTYVHMGHVEIPAWMQTQVLCVANKYMMRGLESLCEQAIISTLTPANVQEVYGICNQLPLFSRQLPNACLTVALAGWADRGCFGTPAADRQLRQHMEPELRAWLTDTLLATTFEPEPEVEDWFLAGGGGTDDEDDEDQDGDDDDA